MRSSAICGFLSYRKNLPKKAFSSIALIISVIVANEFAHAQVALPSQFKRKSVSPAERQAATIEAERSARLDSQADKTAYKSVGSDSSVALIPAADAEKVLRSALASVNSGVSEILIRTSDWQSMDPESGKNRTAQGGVGPTQKKTSGSGPEKMNNAAAKPSPKWGYDADNGPGRWGRLHSSFRACNSGRMQSPIDIWSSEVDPTVSAAPVEFSYSPVGMRATVTDAKQLKIRVQAGSWISYNGDVYHLESVEFRVPGEGRLDGMGGVMSIHLHHRSTHGKAAVVAVPVQVLNQSSSVIDSLWGLMARPDHAVQSVNPSDLLPKSREFYHYMGSLTQPPCTEGVAWFVMRDSIVMSRTQFLAYARAFEANARPAQRRLGRLVMSSAL